MYRRSLTISALLLFTTATLFGCGKDAALETYKDNMTVFYDNITAENDSINAIDPTTESAVEELLSSLDDIEQEFSSLAEMEVPDQFSAVESLADEASAYMTEAVGLYHQAFEAETYDEASALLAEESYQRAIKRVQYIGDILMGTIPDDENVKIEYEEDTDPESQEQSEEAPTS